MRNISSYGRLYVTRVLKRDIVGAHQKSFLDVFCFALTRCGTLGLELKSFLDAFCFSCTFVGALGFRHHLHCLSVPKKASWTCSARHDPLWDLGDFVTVWLYDFS